MYGKLVMSEDELIAQAAVERTASNVYGHKVVGVTADEAIAQAKAAAVPTYTEDQMVTLLDETPALFGELMASELTRAEGPREMAVTALLLAAEKTGQSPEVIAQLEALIASFGTPESSAS